METIKLIIEWLQIWESLFISALDKTSFEGVTGPVRFKGNSRRGNIVIKQIVRK